MKPAPPITFFALITLIAPDRRSTERNALSPHCLTTAIGYIPTLFLQMLHQYGGVETAKRLLATTEAQTGLYRMWELGLLKETVEAHVIQEKYRELFTEAEVQEARRRFSAKPAEALPLILQACPAKISCPTFSC